MKKIAAILLPLSILVFGSCEKTKEDINKLTEFDINYATSFTVPAVSYTVNMPVDVTTPEITTGSASRFSSENTTSSLVDEIKMTKFHLSTSSGNLDYLKSVAIYLRTNNMAEVLIASKSNIPAGTTSIAADLANVNIKDYIVKDRVAFRVRIEFASGITGDQQLKTDNTVHVKARLIK